MDVKTMTNQLISIICSNLGPNRTLRSTFMPLFWFWEKLKASLFQPSLLIFMLTLAMSHSLVPLLI
ncbi:Uncharacterized protein TCM_009482 [Theobroma cacao]|uniref:Uncharacterized protein n=1 Tax=Theobroma cacao TaxID=3641 RepID=A0A061E502_THECC|nr:Uncharacterized protein TCM_009482 [Theobroma cacao]